MSQAGLVTILEQLAVKWKHGHTHRFISEHPRGSDHSAEGTVAMSESRRGELGKWWESLMSSQLVSRRRRQHSVGTVRNMVVE